MLLNGPAGHGQDPPGPRGGRARRACRSSRSRAVGIHPDVRRGRGQPGPRHVQDGQGKFPLHPVHRRDRRRRPHPRARGWAGGTTSASRRSTRSSPRWTDSPRMRSVIVLAATNRPDVLDPALLRPGRFDRHVTVDRPDQEGADGRSSRSTPATSPLADDVDLDNIARGTVGMSGADLANLVNEAALLADPRGQADGRHGSTSTPHATRSSWAPSARRSSPPRSRG